MVVKIDCQWFIKMFEADFIFFGGGGGGGIQPCTVPQSIQSARLSIQLSELGPPTLSPVRECCSPPFGYKGRDTLACGEGGGEI
jgi:hypothetical protein